MADEIKEDPDQMTLDGDIGGAKKRKTAVQIACQRCRKMKQACDSEKPVCGPCSRRKVKFCVYEREVFPKESRQAAIKRDLLQAEDDLRRSRDECDKYKGQLEEVTDALSFLRTRSEQETMQIWRWVKSDPCPIKALASITVPTSYPGWTSTVACTTSQHFHHVSQQQHDPRHHQQNSQRDQRQQLPPLASYHLQPYLTQHPPPPPQQSTQYPDHQHHHSHEYE
ncbi:uncharacterized protein K489DRAFT_403701 [Dissoconium aciculare CBS 342.82]|uniref:Zn(2)-C6 fungal-type domain-containing protein n=1 Tax=Dissoconium aciculare CBS 342.82 TaxID=1314786 RepID=A0A6J3LXA7_9PEZI|nr:uncharacterized protein K489DRAFT_403701 [Dissoconium aciculare CBS 342.82]KAF1820385.1 hypothetical protein K489DRAFT_403701 [Dissoconium aciculare CBS 342.82]